MLRGSISKSGLKQLLVENGHSDAEDVLASIERVLALRFLKGAEKKIYGEEPLVILVDDRYICSDSLKEAFKNQTFLNFYKDIIDVALRKNLAYPNILTIGQRYSRRDVLKLMNFEKDEPPLNIGGYKIDKFSNSCPIFVTYHKADDISETLKYEDEFLSEKTLKWFSKNKRSLDSADVKQILGAKESGLRLELFVIKDDSEGGEFYYLGPLGVLEGTAQETERNGESIVSMVFELQQSVDDSLYRYITEK